MMPPCDKSPDGQHEWGSSRKENTRMCLYCGRSRFAPTPSAWTLGDSSADGGRLTTQGGRVSTSDH